MALDRVNRVLQRIEKGFTDVSWVVCVFVTLLIVVDITLRYFFQKPLPATWEINEICMPFIVFFPFAYTTTINAHVRVSLIKDLMPPKVQSRFEMAGNLICFVICAMLTYWSWLRFVESFLIREEMLAAIRLPWWVGKMAMPLGLGMFTIRYFMQFLIHVYSKK